jgi:hypothetical protein
LSYETLKARTLTFLEERKRSYLWGVRALTQKLRPTPDADMMLADLARFCRATEDTLGTTTEGTYILIGRRQVFLRLTQHLNLTPAQLFDLYAKHRAPTEDET